MEFVINFITWFLPDSMFVSKNVLIWKVFRIFYIYNISIFFHKYLVNRPGLNDNTQFKTFKCTDRGNFYNCFRPNTVVTTPTPFIRLCEFVYMRSKLPQQTVTDLYNQRKSLI